MEFGSGVPLGPTWLWAAARIDTGPLYYVGLAVVVLIVVGALIAAYRTWEEIHDVEEPDSPSDLLETFRQAHAEGEIDDEELERVRSLLGGDEGGVPGEAARVQQTDAAANGDRRPHVDEPMDSVESEGAGPGLI